MNAWLYRTEVGDIPARAQRLEPSWKGALKSAAPWFMHVVRLARWMNNQVRFPIAATVIELHARRRILGGPFKGMRFAGSGIGGPYYPALLGTYEWVLIPVIEDVIARAPATIIDVGAAYGYYALGFAIRCPAAKVVGYEMDPTRASIIARLSRQNDVEDRLEVRGMCTSEQLRRDLAVPGDVFLLMDVEGAEDTLLDPAKIAGLQRAEILVELHDHMVPGVTDRLLRRFARTHSQTVIRDDCPPAKAAQFGRLKDARYLHSTLVRMTDEHRGAEMSWLHLVPLRASVQSLGK